MYAKEDSRTEFLYAFNAVNIIEYILLIIKFKCI